MSSSFPYSYLVSKPAISVRNEGSKVAIPAAPGSDCGTLCERFGARGEPWQCGRLRAGRPGVSGQRRAWGAARLLGLVGRSPPREPGERRRDSARARWKNQVRLLSCQSTRCLCIRMCICHSLVFCVSITFKSVYPLMRCSGHNSLICCWIRFLNSNFVIACMKESVQPWPPSHSHTLSGSLWVPPEAPSQGGLVCQTLVSRTLTSLA